MTRGLKITQESRQREGKNITRAAPQRTETSEKRAESALRLGLPGRRVARQRNARNRGRIIIPSSTKATHGSHPSVPLHDSSLLFLLVCFEPSRNSHKIPAALSLPVCYNRTIEMLVTPTFPRTRLKREPLKGSSTTREIQLYGFPSMRLHIQIIRVCSASWLNIENSCERGEAAPMETTEKMDQAV